MPITKEDVINCYRYLLNREPESEGVVNARFDSCKNEDREALISGFIKSDEFMNRLKYRGGYINHIRSGFQDADKAILHKYEDYETMPEKDCITDWLGIKHCMSDVPFVPIERAGSRMYGLPIPDDSMHAETIEYVSILTSIEACQREEFTMAELGAGWGPWMSIGGLCARKKGIKKINLVGVEGEENKIPLIRHHLEKNGIRPKESEDNFTEYDGFSVKIYQGVINDGKDALFPLVDTSSLGASLYNAPISNEVIHVKGYTMKELIGEFDVVDFVHIDIQGYEDELISEQHEIFEGKVRFIGIGTHSRGIENTLLMNLPSYGFKLMREMPCCVAPMDGTPRNAVDMTVVDGFQLWVNKNLVTG